MKKQVEPKLTLTERQDEMRERMKRIKCNCRLTDAEEQKIVLLRQEKPRVNYKELERMFGMSRSGMLAIIKRRQKTAMALPQ